MKRYGLVEGHLLRSLDPRDDERTVEIVHVSDDGERYKVVNVATHRLTTLSRDFIERRWEIVGMPGERCVEAERDRYREALREIATRPTFERNPDGVDQAAATMQLIARDALELFSRGSDA